MTAIPAYETIGIVDIELEGEDYHNMFIKRMDETSLLVESSRTFDTNKEYTFRYTLPVLDWVFEAKGTIQEIQGQNETISSGEHILRINLFSMDSQDQEKMLEFVEMYKAGKTEIKDIL